MDASLFKLDGKLLNAEELLELYKTGPKIIDTYFMKFFRFAATQVSGSKKKDGVLRKELRRFHKPDGTGYENKFVNILTSKIDREKKEMRAGLLYTTAKIPHLIMEGLEKGFDRTKSGGYFIIPNHENVKSKKPLDLFKSMLSSKQLTFTFKNGRILYFDKSSSTLKLMFVGVKSIHIKKKFDFESLINGVTPKLLKKSETVLQTAVDDIATNRKFTDHDIGE